MTSSDLKNRMGGQGGGQKLLEGLCMQACLYLPGLYQTAAVALIADPPGLSWYLQNKIQPHRVLNTGVVKTDIWRTNQED